MFPVFLFLFSVGVRFCEYYQYKHSENQSELMNFSTYFNCLWFVAMTMTTVGYGDMFPITLMGKLFSFIICLFGSFFISLSFVSLLKMITLNQQQNRALCLIQTLSLKQRLKHIAADIIVNTFRLNSYLSKNRLNTKIYSTYKFFVICDRLKKLIYSFKITKS